MTDEVNPRRAYNSSRRRELAQVARARVLVAARDTFLEQGYAGTTVPAVADAAGVSVETVYKSVGNKATLVKAVFDVAIVGDDEPVPLRMRATIQAIEAQPEPARKLAMYGRHVGQIGGRIGPILLVVRAAAESDAGAAGVWAALQAERLHGMTMFADHLGTGGHLRRGVNRAEAHDVLWTHNSVELAEASCANEGGATPASAGGWAGDSSRRCSDRPAYADHDAFPADDLRARRRGVERPGTRPRSA